MKVAILLIILFVESASAQIWYTGDPTRKSRTKIEDGFLVTHAPIKILQPPKLSWMKVLWDRSAGMWTIDLESDVVLDPIYKPCCFMYGEWCGYTFRAGERNGKSFFTLGPKSYEQAIMLRDALITLHKFAPENVSTEDREAEKLHE